ncbi:MAG: hypothetical protein Q7T41_04070 [Candidatus Saccharibacteria bacterium]|nr:hypothetical protein [Candidatus Saccharibacteria bacterium]
MSDNNPLEKVLPFLEAFTLRSQSPELLAEIRGRHALVVEAVKESNIAFAMIESEVRVATGRMAEVARTTDTILRDEVKLDKPAQAVHEQSVASNVADFVAYKARKETTTLESQDQQFMADDARAQLDALRGTRETDGSVVVVDFKRYADDVMDLKTAI